MKRILLLSFAMLFGLFGQTYAQERTVSGKVTAFEDNSPLPGVTVVLKEAGTGVSTDLDGNYKINVPASGGTLVFSFVGYTSEEVAIGARSVVDMALTADIRQLSEVVVVGYGTQAKTELTGAISSVSSKDFENMPFRNIDQALQGRAAGVNIVQSSGTPGAGISVNIRGVGSLNASSQPLYVIDGVPINTGSYTAIGAGGQLTNALSDLNPNDIESFEVLKDAAAAAIYGSRAANGVVLITTKSGKAGKTKIDFGYYTGVQQRRNDGVEKISGPENVALMREMMENRFPRNAAGEIRGLIAGFPWESYAHMTAWQFSEAGAALNASGRIITLDNGDGIRDVSNFEDPSTAFNTDWMDLVFRSARIDQYDLAFSGGTDKTNFRFSTTYFNQDGIMIGSGFERFSARLNLNNEVSERIRFGTNMAVSRSVALRPQNDNNINGVLSTAVLVANDIPVYLADGVTYAKDPGASTENPLAAGLEPFFNSVSSRLIGNTYGEVDLARGLKFRTELGVDFLLFKDDRFQPTTTNTGAGSNGLGQSSSRTDLNWVWKNNITYSTTIADDHKINALVGIEYQESIFESLFAQAVNFPGNSIRRLSAGSVKQDASSGGSIWGIESYLARVNYGFRGKYLVGASVRVDGSSRFGAEKRYGTFPSVSAAWRVAEESFLSNIDVLSELKVRTSYGLAGNQEIGNFASLPLFGVGANYIRQAGLAPTQLGNPILTWEQAKIFNVGIDVGLLRDRIYLQAEYYVKDNDGLLQNLPLVGNSGFTGITQNVGAIRNSGLEFTLTTVNVSKRDFRWTTDFNMTFNKNEVTALAGAPFASGFASWVEEGQPLGSFRGFRVDKIIQNAEDLQIARDRGQSQAQLGDIMFKDLDGDGLVTGNDQEILGNAQPLFFGGLNNTINYKNWDFSVFGRFSYGNLIYNNTRAFSEGMNGVFGQTSGVRERWTPDNPSTTMPRAVFGDPNNNRRVSDRWLEDGSFFRINNFQLGYTLPKSVLSRVNIRNARVYASGQNLITLTRYSGFEPEVSTFNITNTAPGTDFLTFPQARVVTFGVNFGL